MGKFRIFFNWLWLSAYPDHHETYYRADRSKCKNCIRTHVLFVVQNTKFTPSVRNCAQRKAEIGRAWGEVVKARVDPPLRVQRRGGGGRGLHYICGTRTYMYIYI
jgi:hypothetical protein